MVYPDFNEFIGALSARILSARAATSHEQRLYENDS
jgi:uncharacterized DUF497 family protein